jgi:xanthine dehydrogenase small subunit
VQVDAVCPKSPRHAPVPDADLGRLGGSGEKDYASPMADVTFRLNGRDVALAGTEPTESLLRWLKRARLHGTKEGCADGDCGACTVALVEPDTQGRPRYRAVNSCLLPMGQLGGRDVVTVEALSDDNGLHPVQQAMVDRAGSQCGYCTPGFVMSLFAGYYSGELTDATFEGNLCRCTGYLPIRAAVACLAAAPRVDDRHAQRLREPLRSTEAHALGPFHNPGSVDEALALKARLPEAVWVGGATDLGVALSHGQTVAPAFIALDRIDALKRIVVGDDRVRIGAGADLSTLEAALHGVFPALDTMLAWFAARQVRNRATVGGNLGTASPIGDLLPVLLALDAVVILQSVRGPRQVAIDAYFLDYRKTARAPDELIVAIDIPRRPGLRSAAYKIAKRQTDDISIVAAVYALAFDDAGRIGHARLAYGGVAATPRRAIATEDWLRGRLLDKDIVTGAVARLQAEFAPISDHRASAAYRRAVCGTLFAKFASEVAG